MTGSLGLMDSAASETIKAPIERSRDSYIIALNIGVHGAIDKQRSTYKDIGYSHGRFNINAGRRSSTRQSMTQ